MRSPNDPADLSPHPGFILSLREFGSAETKILGLAVRPAALLVWTVWALCTAAAAGLVWRQGVTLPWSDDWAMIPAITDVQPVTLKWLWAQHVEHRIPLPKLFYVLTVRLAHGDYRSQLFGNIATLSLVTAVLLFTVRKLRGRLNLFDALIPLVLLNFGQGAMGWGFHFQFVSATALGCCLLAVLLWNGAELNGWAVVLAGVCLLALPLCGGSGLLYVVVVGPWIALRGLGQIFGFFAAKDSAARPLPVAPKTRRRFAGFALTAFAFGALVLCAAYFVDYAQPARRVKAGLLLIVETAGRILSSSFGMSGPDFYPYSAIITAALFIWALVWAARRGMKSSDDWTGRLRLLDLAVFLTAVFGLIFAVGYGRGGIWVGSMNAHYTSLASPALLGIYLVLSRATPTFSNVITQAALLICMIVLNGSYLRAFHRSSLFHQIYTMDIRRDLSAGLPAATVTDRHITKLFYLDVPEGRALVESGLRQLRNAGFSLYGPPERESARAK